MGESQWPELMTTTEVAAVLRVSKMTVYRLISGGQVEARRIGRSFRVLESSLRDYMKVGDQ
jgi:excisionase family DNA binding protein